MTSRMISIVVGAVLAGFLCPSADAQTVIKDAAYWQSYVSSMRPSDTLKATTTDGRTLRGRLVSTTADDMLIIRQRAFKRGIEQRVRFDAVKSISRTHPTRNQLIALPIGGFVGWLLAAAMLAG